MPLGEQVGTDALGGDGGNLVGALDQLLVGNPAPAAQHQEAGEHGGDGPAEAPPAASLACSQRLELVLEPQQQVLERALAAGTVEQMIVGLETLDVGALQGAALGLVGGGVGRLAEVGVGAREVEPFKKKPEVGGKPPALMSASSWSRSAAVSTTSVRLNVRVPPFSR